MFYGIAGTTHVYIFCIDMHHIPSAVGDTNIEHSHVRLGRFNNGNN